MRHGHVAFFITPHYPHFYATLPMVSTLVKRGHRVTYVTSDLFESAASHAGAEVVGRPRLRFDVAQDNETEPGFCGLAIQTLRKVTPFYEANRPDLIVYDLVDFAGRILAHRWNIPAAHISPHFAFDRDTLSQQIRGSELREIALASSRSADEFLRRFGVPSDGFLFHKEMLNIYAFPKLLQPPGVRLDDRYLYAGRCAGEHPGSGDWRIGDIERPVVLIASSTTNVRDRSYYMMCVEALSGLGVHVLFSVGAHVEAVSNLAFPDHFEVLRDVSHVKVLPHCDVLVYQGGTATTSEAAYYGVPLVAVTDGLPELEWLADNMAEVGLGLHLRKAGTNADSLRECVRLALTSNAIRRRVQQVKQIVRSEPGAEEVANRLEELLPGD